MLFIPPNSKDHLLKSCLWNSYETLKKFLGFLFYFHSHLLSCHNFFRHIFILISHSTNWFNHIINGNQTTSKTSLDCTIHTIKTAPSCYLVYFKTTISLIADSYYASTSRFLQHQSIIFQCVMRSMISR